MIDVRECDIEFLKELNAATVQLLGFTGIILTVAFAAYYSSLAHMNEISKGYLELSEKLKQDQSPNITPAQRAQLQEFYLRKQLELPPIIESTESAFRTSFKAFVVAASSFAILVTIGLLQVRICFCPVIAELFFFCESFLLVFGIEILLFGLYAFIRASQTSS